MALKYEDAFLGQMCQKQFFFFHTTVTFQLRSQFCGPSECELAGAPSNCLKILRIN